MSTFAQAAQRHVQDARGATAAQRWAWLCEAIEIGIANARRRARRGLVTYHTDGSVFWSPELEQAWYPAQREPDHGPSPQ